MTWGELDMRRCTPARIKMVQNGRKVPGLEENIKWPNRARAWKNEKWPNSARTTKIHRMEERQVERRETNRERKAKWSLGSNELHRLGTRDTQYHNSCNGIVRDKRCCLVWISVKGPSSAPYKRLYVLHCTSVKMAEKCQSRKTWWPKSATRGKQSPLSVQPSDFECSNYKAKHSPFPGFA